MGNYIESCTRIATSPKPPTIKVGSQWKRNSDGKQCVVVRAKEPAAGNYDPMIRYANEAETPHMPKRHLQQFYTYLFTPAEDLSNVPDGAKIVGFDGVVVTKLDDRLGFVSIGDSDGKLHSVNGLPSVSEVGDHLSWYRHGVLHREEGPATEYANGDKVFSLNGENLEPDEWGRQIHAMGKADGVKEAYRHLLPKEEPEASEPAEGPKLKSKKPPRFYSVEQREEKTFAAWLVFNEYGAQTRIAKFYFDSHADDAAALLNKHCIRQLESGVRDGE